MLSMTHKSFSLEKTRDVDEHSLDSGISSSISSSSIIVGGNSSKSTSISDSEESEKKISKQLSDCDKNDLSDRNVSSICSIDKHCSFNSDMAGNNRKHWKAQHSIVNDKQLPQDETDNNENEFPLAGDDDQVPPIESA